MEKKKISLKLSWQVHSQQTETADDRPHTAAIDFINVPIYSTNVHHPPINAAHL